MRKQKGNDMTRTCYECKAPLSVRRKNYQYTQCGLPNVVLRNIIVEECRECGTEHPNIPAIAGLHRTIMILLLKKETLLTGEEIRFLRKMANLTGVELAKLMGVTSTQISKWENNNRPISATSDRVLRLICYSGLLERMLKNNRLSIRDWLKNIEREVTGPKRLTIDPELLASHTPEDLVGDQETASVH